MGAQAIPMRQGKPALNDLAVDSGQREGRSPVRLAIVAGAAAVLAAGAGILYAVFAPSPADTVAAGKADSIFTSAYSADAARGYDDFSGAGPRPMPVCGDRPGENCVVDGETFWLSGRKIRLANIAAPNSDKARCPAEAARARDAAETLAELLDRQPIEIRAKGRDRYGRLLATIETAEGDVGRNLVRFKVAVPWRGGKEPDTDWCG